MTASPKLNTHPYLRLFGLILAITVVFYASDILLLLFASVLGALFIYRVGLLVKRRTGLSYVASVGLLLFLLVASITAFVMLAGANLCEQLAELVEQLPNSLAKAQAMVADYPNLASFVQTATEDLSDVSLDKYWGQAKSIFSGALGFFSSLLLCLTSVLYLGIQPDPYKRGARGLFIKLFGPHQGPRLLNDLGSHLWGFLVGQLQTMLILGILTTGGLWLIGMPLAIALGVIAGGLAFIPILGPILSTIPAVIIALAEGPTMILYVLALYGGIQLLESNLITPLIQKENSDLPPVLALSFQAVLATLCGPMGVIVAAPLAVVGMVLGTHWLSTDEDLLNTSSPNS